MDENEYQRLNRINKAHVETVNSYIIYNARLFDSRKCLSTELSEIKDISKKLADELRFMVRYFSQSPGGCWQHGQKALNIYDNFCARQALAQEKEQP